VLKNELGLTPIQLGYAVFNLVEMNEINHPLNTENIPKTAATDRFEPF
jgi:hypothetical protein